MARIVGYGAVKRWLGNRIDAGLMGSQATLMLTVFGLRLLPFVSFDVVSYAAGLTPIATWRYAVATLIGMTPASILLTHFGGQMTSGDAERVTWALAGLALMMLVPVAVKVLWSHRRGGT